MQENLGAEYDIKYPKLQTDESVSDFGWTKQIAQKVLETVFNGNSKSIETIKVEGRQIIITNMKLYPLADGGNDAITADAIIPFNKTLSHPFKGYMF